MEISAEITNSAGPVSLIAQYTLDLGRFGRLVSRVQAFGSDTVHFDPSNSAETRQKAYWLLNTRIAWYSEDERFFAEGFVDNFLDKDIQSYKAFGSNLLGSPVSTGYEAPRTFGVRVGFSW